MLEFTPFTLEEHRRRYAAAVAKAIDVESIAIGVAVNPIENNPTYTFDCHDGMRLLISREVLPRGARVIHMSASVQPNTQIYRQAITGQMSLEAFMRLAQGRFAKISGDTRPLTFLDFSHEKRVLHWLLYEKPADAIAADLAS